MNNFNSSEPFVLVGSNSEDEVGHAIDLIRIKRRPHGILVELLSERHSVYKERPNYQMVRIKGYAMASFANIGLPDYALSFVLDELQNGKDAYMVAAAARALRGSKRRSSTYVKFLLKALSNISYHDDYMSLDVFKPLWPLKHGTTAKKQIFLTFQWLQGSAKGALPELRSFSNNNYDFDLETRDEIRKTIAIIESAECVLDRECCEVEGRPPSRFRRLTRNARTINSIGHLLVENENGRCLPLKAITEGKLTVVAFFYTRCMNPNKCTLTINKLGWLQQELIKSGMEDKVNIIAFTYDATYDTPSKMYLFGENRGLKFGPNVHMLRTNPKDFPLLSDFFELGVNHVASTVNQHRIELFVVTQNGNIGTAYTRLQWELKHVIKDIEALLKKDRRFGALSSIIGATRQVGFPVLLALFPKCPICWAIYLSAFGVPGLKRIPYSPLLIPFIILAIVINLIMLYRMANVRNGLTPFRLSGIGGILVIGSSYQYSSQIYSIVGIALILIGALLNGLSYLEWSRLSYFISSTIGKIKRVNSKMLKNFMVQKMFINSKVNNAKMQK